MKFNSQTTPLTTFSLLLTTCHAAQTHTFRLVAPMGALTNLQIGMEHPKKAWKQVQRRGDLVIQFNDIRIFNSRFVPNTVFI